MAAPTVNPAPVRPGIRTIALENPLSQSVFGAGKTAASGGRAIVANFRTKPFQTTVLTLGYVVWLLLLLSTFTNWWAFATRGVGGLEVWGGASLHTLAVCFDDRGGRRRWTNSRFCTSVALADVAWALDYFHVAGAVSFTFVLVPLLLVAAANHFVNMRRRDELDARIHPRLGAFKSPLLPLALYAASAVLLTVAWVSYVAMVEAHFNATDFQRVTLAAGVWDRRMYGLGFGAAIAGCLLLGPAMVLLAVFRNEVNRDEAAARAHGAAAMAAAAGGGGAMFTGTAVEPAPTTAKAPYYPTESADIASPPRGGGGGGAGEYAAAPGGVATTTPPGYYRVSVAGAPAAAAAAAAHARGPSVGVHGTHVPAPLPPAEDAPAGTGEGSGGSGGGGGTV